MPTLDLISSGLTSVRQGQNRINAAASEIASAGLPADPALNAAQI